MQDAGKRAQEVFKPIHTPVWVLAEMRFCGFWTTLVFGKSISQIELQDMKDSTYWEKPQRMAKLELYYTPPTVEGRTS
jgi:nitrous oxide reductase accessory protein NosL